MLPSSRISLPSLLSDDSTLSRGRWLGSSPKLKLRVKLGKELDFFGFKTGFWFWGSPWSSWYLYDHCSSSTVGVFPLSRKLDAAFGTTVSATGILPGAGRFDKFGSAGVVFSFAGILRNGGALIAERSILAVLILASGCLARGGWKW